jgi:heat-inducible transcriptional repressor
VELTNRQSIVLRHVVEAHVSLGQPVGSKWLADRFDMPWKSSTIRAELARLEELGLLQHPHTSAGRVPTDHGYRHYVDELGDQDLPDRPRLRLPAVRAEIDDAMRATTEQLSQVTNLLAIVSAPPLGTTTIKHIEVLLLQPQMAMVVVITSTGGVTKRVAPFDAPIDAGLVKWAHSYLNEVLGGLAIGARMLHSKLMAPDLSERERAFLAKLEPVFTELDDTAADTLFVEGAARLMSEDRIPELSQINDLMKVLERRVVLLSVLRSALEAPSVYLRIGSENEEPELRSLTVVAANYGIATRNLGTVSVLGPTRMDYPTAIASVRGAAAELSRFVGELYDE